MAFVIDWASSAPIFLQAVSSSCERLGDHQTIRKLRLVCQAWRAATSHSVEQWHPQQSCNITKLLAVAQAFPNLTRVSLEHCSFGQKPDLLPLLKLSSLRELHLGNNAIKVASDASLALEQLNNLRGLDFCPTGDVASLRVSCLHKLSSMCLRGPDLDTALRHECFDWIGVIAVPALLQQCNVMKHLQVIMLLRMALGLDAYKALAELRQTRHLSIIDCGDTNLGFDHDAPAVTALAAFESICQLVDLTELTIRRSLDDLCSITCISGLINLTKLDLRHGRCIQSLDGLQHVTAIRWLSVSDVTSISSLEPIRGLTGLQELHFARCLNIQSFGGVDVLSSLTDLRVLDMQRCAFHSTWVQLLTGLSALHNLDMSVGNWRDQDIAHLSACTSLRFLGLRDCPSTTHSMHQILQERLPALETIEVACTTSGDQYAGFLGWPY